MRRLLIPAAVLLTALTFAVPAGARPTSAAIIHATQVVRDTVPTPKTGQSDVVVQSQVATNPHVPGFAAAVTEEGLQTTPAGTFGIALGLAVTRNGGRTWHSRVVPGITTAAGGEWLGVSWPTVAVAADGTIYVVASVRSDDPCRQGLGVVRSTDGGRRFGPLVLVRSHTTCGVLEGRSSLAVDQGRRSRHRGRLYLAWTSYRTDADGNETGQVQTLSYAGPAAKAWSTPADITAPDSLTFGNTLMIGPAGRLTDVYGANSADFSQQYLESSTSFDAGRTFAAPVVVSQWPLATVGGQDIRCCAPSATTDPVTGETYAAISDPRFQDGKYDDAVLFRTGDGKHWSAAIRADINGDGLEHLTPEVAAFGGTVYATWAVTTDPNGTGVQQQMSRSTDAGASFGPSVDLGPKGDLRYSPLAAGFGYYLGDVTGISATAARAYAVWPLPTTAPAGAQHQTLWAATIRNR